MSAAFGRLRVIAAVVACAAAVAALALAGVPSPAGATVPPRVLTLARASSVTQGFARSLYLRLDFPEAYGVDGCQRINARTVDCRYHTVEFAIPLNSAIRCDDVLRVYLLPGSFRPRTNPTVTLQPACRPI